MQVFLIEENIKSNFLKTFFKIIEIKEDKILINGKCKNMKLQKKKKLVDEIYKVLQKNNSKKVIISKNLKQDQELVNLLNSLGLDIIQGKLLFKIMANEFIESVCKENDLKKEDIRVGIAVNYVDEWCIKLIEDLSKKFKMVNIVTSKVNYLKKIQSSLYEENGIIITLTNNKKKALFNSNLILNIDFPEELINQYRIFDESIIINFEENIKIKKKRFCGKILNDYSIGFKEGSSLKENIEKPDENKQEKKTLI